MEGLWVLLMVLICPIAMGAMMFFMMRGRGGHDEHGGKETPDRVEK